MAKTGLIPAFAQESSVALLSVLRGHTPVSGLSTFPKPYITLYSASITLCNAVFGARRDELQAATRQGKYPEGTSYLGMGAEGEVFVEEQLAGHLQHSLASVPSPDLLIGRFRAVYIPMPHDVRETDCTLIRANYA